MKLVVEEAESAALRRLLTGWPQRITSALSLVEVPRAAARREPPVPPARPRQVLAGFTLLPLDHDVLERAATVAGGLRSLDALHLASALSLGSELGPFIAYDARLNAAAREAGLALGRGSAGGG